MSNNKSKEIRVLGLPTYPYMVTTLKVMKVECEHSIIKSHPMIRQRVEVISYKYCLSISHKEVGLELRVRSENKS